MRRTGTPLALVAAVVALAFAAPRRRQAEAGPAAVDVSKAGACEFIAQPHSPLCMLPFPSDHFTRRDPSSPTGRRIDFGDHQVTIYQADVMARTIGAAAHRPVLYPGRWPDTDVLWGVPSIRHYPYTGSAIYYWDAGPVRPDPANPGAVIGTEPPPYENVPNRSGQDPHGAPRATPVEQQLVSDFFDGAILQRDDCGGGPCYSAGFSGP